MSDLVAQLEVLARENGCLIDLSAILDLSVCPTIDIKTPKPHHVREHDDYICVTPTEHNKHLSTRNDDDHYKVPEHVCKQSEVALDLDLLIVLGLITEAELEVYLRDMGHLHRNEHLCYHQEQCMVDPYLSYHHHRSHEPLLSLDIGNKHRPHDGFVDLDVLGRHGLINLDILSREGLVDLNIRGHEVLNLRRSLQDETASHLAARGGNDHDHDQHHRGDTCHEEPVLSHYQPLCGKTFKHEHRGHMKHHHVVDVNHCLALCHADAALLTVNADVQVADLAHVQVCAAVEFDEAARGETDNCHYFVKPHGEPCHDGELEVGVDVTAFLRI